MRKITFILLLASLPAFALDWKQPMTDEEGISLTDCPIDPTTKLPEKCGKILTIGRMSARLLCSPQQQNMSGSAKPEQLSMECDFGKKILREPDTVATPDELKFTCDAIGRSPSPLVISDGYEILGCKKPVK